MNRIVSAVITASVSIFLAFLLTGEAVAQTAKDLLGTWLIVSVAIERDGKKTDLYGPNPQGQVIFDASGHFSFIITRPDVSKFASNSREQGTTEENQSVVRGSLAYFGTYSVNETDQVLNLQIEGSTFPNYKGTATKRPFKLSGDNLTWTAATTSVGTGTAYAVLKRAR